MKYTGKDLDEDTGLYYYNARWYDAGTGRFISEDPARDGSNWYSYVTNNPLKFVDPAGMRRVIGEDENGDLTLENPNGDLVGRSHGDDRNDGGNEPPKKDEPEKKSLWGRFVENAQNAYRKNKINELMDRLPEDVKSQLQELGISPEMIIDGMSGDFSSFSDFSGVFYRGTGMSAYGFAGLSNEAGIAYLFESGAVVDSKKYQSISAGWILDGGANAYEVLGLIPDAKWGDFMGVGGAMSIGQTIIKTPYLDMGVAGGWTTPREGINGFEAYATAGKSFFTKDINAGSVTYTKEFNSRASSFYIPPEGGY